MERNTGVYAIRNTANEKIYVGSSKSIQHRWEHNHLPMLKSNTHFNAHLQNAWNKYGEKSFVLEVLELCAEIELEDREGYWIENKKSWDRAYGYNFTRLIGKHVRHPETQQKIVDTRRKAKYWQNGINAQILDLYTSGMKKNAIAKQLGICRNAVYTCLEHNGLHTRSGNGAEIKLTKEIKWRIQELRNSGLSWSEISKQCGVSKTQLDRVMKIRDGKYGGDKVKRQTYHTLTPEKEQEAIRLRKENKSWKEIGQELGVSRQVFYWHGLAKEQQGMVRKKVTPEAIVEAKLLKEQGFTCPQIGKRLGYSEATFRRYL